MDQRSERMKAGLIAGHKQKTPRNKTAKYFVAALITGQKNTKNKTSKFNLQQAREEEGILHI